jgi:uncharacterized cupredoxin-like copper-binding protein
MRESFGVRGLPPLQLFTVLANAGRAAAGPAIEVAAGSGPVAMRVGDFDFEPAVLQVKGPRALTLQIANDSGTAHDFTLKDPAGGVIARVELPSNVTSTATVNLAAPGTYRFDCGKPLHATLGMKGRIVVTMQGAAHPAPGAGAPRSYCART